MYKEQYGEYSDVRVYGIRKCLEYKKTYQNKWWLKQNQAWSATLT